MVDPLNILTEGELVRLKSGGPTMVVTEVGSDLAVPQLGCDKSEVVHCVWSDWRGQVHRHLFEPYALVRAEAPKDVVSG